MEELHYVEVDKLWDGPLDDDDDDYADLAEWESIDEAARHEPPNCDHGACGNDDLETSVGASMELVMFTMLAVLLFIMWLMVRNCRKPASVEDNSA